MTVKISPVFNDAQLDSSGNPATGYKLFTYTAGSSTKQTVYQDSGGISQHTNPILLNSRGEPPAPIWLTAGGAYKFIFTSPTDSDPPVSAIRTVDNVSGVNDPAVTAIDEWITSGLTPTFASATTFTLSGDQTTKFNVGRRLKTTNSGGTVYSTISASAFGALTTVTVVNDSGTLDSGLSAVSYGLLSKANDSIPRQIFPTLAHVKGHLSGLKLSNGTDATNDIDIAAGVAISDDGLYAMTLASSLTKQLDAAWAVGTNAGGRASGAVIANSTYHVFLIARPDTGVVDVAYDTSATGANLAANTNAAYTKMRRIGSIVRSGGAILAFIQDGDKFVWTGGPVADLNANNPGTAAVTRTLTLPVGIRVEAILNAGIATGSGTSGAAFRLSDLSTTDVAASNTTGQVSATYPATGNTAFGNSECRVFTNTSAQVRSRVSLSDANVAVLIGTTGWIDRRGRDD